ncbi:MAG TPA: hypothetical protein VNK70_00285 [Candidatus Paceibacterota bacterium]|nr:hypothetical protein [Candidatus Paceibacterota bacterium]
MERTMIASAERQKMTDGQIENVVARLRDALRKHREEFGSEPVQKVLGTDNLGMRLLEPFRQLVEAVSNLIIRRVKVDRSRTPQEALDATGRKQYTNRSVVAAMPRGEGEEVEVIFFNLGRYVSDNDLEKEYELRGLMPADPYSLAAVNGADPAFADERPNGTHWKDADGRWCYAAFDRHWDDGRRVRVNRDGRDWSDDWWFAGLRSPQIALGI